MHEQTLELDSSALVHLASRTKRYINTFRVSVTLTKPVIPHLLQAALDRVAPRFPMIAAGIQRGSFQYEVVPTRVPPQVQPERACLASMTDELLQSCGMRVLYQGKKISVEIFHSLTDGYGGLIFLQTLVMEYAVRAYGIPARIPRQSETERKTLADDYRTYAGRTPIPFRQRRVFQFPNRTRRETDITL